MVVRFHRLAAQELRAAHTWYRRRDSEAAEQFLVRVDAAVRCIERDPDSLPIEQRTYRWVRVQRFPYD